MMLPPNTLHNAIAASEMVKEATNEEKSTVRNDQHDRDRELKESERRFQSVNQTQAMEPKQGIIEDDHEEGQRQEQENQPDLWEHRQQQENVPEEFQPNEPAEEMMPIISQEESDIEPPEPNYRTEEEVGEQIDTSA